MKFQNYLSRYSIPNPGFNYLDYYGLKKILTTLEATTTLDSAEFEAVDRFFPHCDAELHRINCHFDSQLRNIKHEWESLDAKQKSLIAYQQDDIRKLHIPQLFQLYSTVVLLANYQLLNVKGFGKLLKHHDRKTDKTNGKLWRQERLIKTELFTSDTLPLIARQIENALTELLEFHSYSAVHRSEGHRGRKEIRKTYATAVVITKLVYFRMGCFFTILLLLLATVIATGCYSGLPYHKVLAERNETSLTNDNLTHFVKILELEKIDWHVVVRLYRGPTSFVMMFLLLAFNISCWRRAKVDPELIFGLGSGRWLSQHQIFEFGTCSGILWCICLLFYFHSDEMGVSENVIPLVVLGMFAAFFFNPSPFLLSARRWVARTIGRVVTSPFGVEGFAESFIGDQLVSLGQGLQDVEYFVCFYTLEAQWKMGNSYTTQPGVCSSSHNTLSPLVAALPSWFRFAQCLRCYYDTKLAFPHLVNAGKYSASIFVLIFTTLNTIQREEFPANDQVLDRPVYLLWILCAVINSCYTFYWDVYMDWGLELHKKTRPKGLKFHYITIYYLAIVEDLLLRRFVWNASRVEDEHVISYKFRTPVLGFPARSRRRGESPSARRRRASPPSSGAIAQQKTQRTYAEVTKNFAVYWLFFFCLDEQLHLAGISPT
ncbi:Xenotropic and polytropic retrovirus receptor 1 [Hypsibius exemplaris]|uniref:Xenotropic and polytropic retrovirus receptor 1 n=1 Tax=Hypsibius exemplaris TaxID=2072580 RepID=A0A9X6NKN5_HYPEX|nr:Xenotropic and polytropic retrovirus receptor 1 [Hypsibius exemplaris]